MVEWRKMSRNFHQLFRFKTLSMSRPYTAGAHTAATAGGSVVRWSQSRVKIHSPFVRVPRSLIPFLRSTSKHLDLCRPQRSLNVLRHLFFVLVFFSSSFVHCKPQGDAKKKTQLDQKPTGLGITAAGELWQTADGK